MSVPAAELVHVWYRCHTCGAQPILGRRFQCQTCPAGPDNDLCEPCYRLFERGSVAHPLPESYAAHVAPARHTFQPFAGLPRERFLPWLAVTGLHATAPVIPDGFVVRPEFRCERGSFFGSYAFVVRSERNGPPLVLTALHVMDELIKTMGIDCSADNTSCTGQELPRLVTGGTLYDVFAANWMLAELGSARSMLILADARVGDEEPYSQRDIAAFRADPSARVSPGRLATGPPDVGQPLWLAVNPGREATSRTFEAVVVELTEATLVFRFAAPTGLPPYSSGAPLLNRDGEVVGINIGGGFLDGHRLGHANHVTSIRRHLGDEEVSDSNLVPSEKAR